uniref:Uncharacterized protein n=1 Tax=Gasterosteus aculeatus aculeatus TaxID=481459 RepID=A0AAQ4RT24_GASAC
MGKGAISVAQSEKDLKLLKTSETSISLPKHSYWFDVWLFVLFDIAFFLVMYYIVP